MAEQDEKLYISSFASIDQSKIYYELAGKGRPLVFIGEDKTFDLRFWNGPFQTLAQAYRVLRFYPRGYGKSPASTAAYSNTKDLFTLLQHLDMLPVSIVDLHARTALQFIHEYPEAVAALILVSPEVGMYRSMVEAMIHLPELLINVWPMVKALKQGDTKKGVEWMLERMQVSPLSVSAETYQWLFDMISENVHVVIHPPKQGTVDMEVVTKQKQRLKDIHVPTLLLQGEYPSATIQETLRILEQELPQFQKVIIPNSHQLLHLENPQAFNHAVLEFLAKSLL